MSRSARVPVRLLVLALLAAGTLAAFWPVLHHDFDEYDDAQYVTRNAHVRGGLTSGGVAWALTSFYASNWHPLTWMSHMLDWRLYGANAGGHHVTSLLLHLLNSCLLFLILHRATGVPGRSAVVAALFAVHPLHVESVAWIAERKDVLSTLFWMLATLAYVRRVPGSGIADRAAVAILFALGLSAKPMLVTLPFTLLLLDFWPLGRWGRDGSARAFPRIPSALLREKLPLFVLSAASCAVTIAAQHRALASMERYPAGVRTGNALVSYAAYLGKTVWPAALSVFYPHTEALAAPLRVAISTLVLVAATVAAFLLRRTRPYVIFGWLWYLGTLVPVIGLVQVGKQAMADRYTYVPLIGIFVIAVWGAADALGALARLRASGGGKRARADQDAAWMALPAAMVLVPLMLATRGQLAYWRDAVTLFTRAVTVADSAVARTNLGEALLNRDRTAEAEEQFRAALRIDPSASEAHNSLGFILEKEGRPDDALRFYKEATRLEPGYAIAHRNLGRLLARLGRLDEAVVHDERSVALDPGDAETLAGLGVALASLGRFGEAALRYEAALRIDPRSPEVENNLGTALSRLGRGDEAFRHFAEAVRLKPGYAVAHYNLATALYDRGAFAEAWTEVRRARALGFLPPPRFLEMLAAKMPEPDGSEGGRRTPTGS
ncbi:MAG: tetratricopeptide repeat protein [Acidobacteriia bacterium]|nr:tetratricopeptide repeat protein [Terriglobia bacterium]